MSKLFSLDLEKYSIGGLINNPNLFPEIDRFITEKDFFIHEHSVIFSSIKQLLLEGKALDKVILTHRIKNLGIKFRGELDIGDYIEAISFNKITEKALLESFKEILKLRVLRNLQASCSKINTHLESNKNEEINKIISDVDAIYATTMNGFNIDEGPINLFEDLKNEILRMGENPIVEIGLTTPFPEFNRMYGGLRDANIYAIASRPGQGKTTFLDYLGYKVSEINDCPVLILDTEMMTNEIKYRTAAALSGVPLWYIETGNWNKNPELREKMLKALETMKKLPVFHKHVGNKNIDEICSVIRRWHWANVKRGGKSLIIYDYLKLTGEKVGQNWAEYQAIGEKTDKLKRIAEEIKAPVFSAIQLNRSGENFNRDSGDVTDDSTAISQSDRVMWFCTFLAIFRRKTLDEIAVDGQGFGTHKLIPIKTRYQGQDAAGHQDVVERQFPDGSRRLVQNYLNFDIDNFSIVDRGSLMDILASQSMNQDDNLEEENDNPVNVVFGG